MILPSTPTPPTPTPTTNPLALLPVPNISPSKMSLSQEWLDSLPIGFNNRYLIVRHGQSEANVASLVSSIFSVSVANHGLTELGVDQAINAKDALVDLILQKPVEEDLLGSPVVQCKNDIILNPLTLDNIVFYVSDFKRAYETGHYLKEALVRYNQDEIKKSAQKNDTFTPAFIAENSQKTTISTDTTTFGHKNIRNISKPVPFFTSPALRERFFGVFEGACPSDDIYDRVWALDKVEDVTSTHFNVESIQSVVTRTTELILELEQIWNNKIIILVSHGDVTQIIQAVFAAIDPRFHRSLPHMANCDVRELSLVKGSE
jgi:broad specificity phosphatase PhoE